MKRDSIIRRDNLKSFKQLLTKVQSKGFTIEEQNDQMPYVVLKKEGMKVDHLSNLILCLATFGIWSLPYLYMSKISSKTKKILVGIDEDGIAFEENCYAG